MTNKQDDLFDDDDEKTASPPGSTEPGSSVSRRTFLRGTGGAATAGVLIGVAGTVGVTLLTDEDEVTSDTVGQLPPSGGVAPAVDPLQSIGVPADFTVSNAVVALNVNGRNYRVSVEANESLLEVLRQRMGLVGTKLGCDRGECSSCTVLIDGVAMNACGTLAVQQEGKQILTIEGLERDGVLSPLQDAFLQEMALQCGFCTPGMIMQSTALLESNPNPTESDIRRALSGNLCKCSAYPNILAAVQRASGNFA